MQISTSFLSIPPEICDNATCLSRPNFNLTEEEIFWILNVQTDLFLSLSNLLEIVSYIDVMVKGKLNFDTLDNL
jgi:hypothetical protein